MKKRKVKINLEFLSNTILFVSICLAFVIAYLYAIKLNLGLKGYLFIGLNSQEAVGLAFLYIFLIIIVVSLICDAIRIIKKNRK
ncbi:MAG: hypothetical protein Q8N63_00790 [Nanoarchaeota archaeon]|nr:hypothetical protein [Nanoarchaeota archaeon]